jgi:uncharacterized protein (TIGR02680 family)
MGDNGAGRQSGGEPIGKPSGRWHLNRAGILNVYQYGDEVLDIEGGRLLLRGVNGSGKSTAMNMLLPFLIEANQRRIDAAGEQSDVLRSWMTSGRTDPNPVGYLWVETRRIDPASGEVSYLVFGCGIRAGASTDRVTTWWFITERRPGIDFSLLDGRTPLTVEGLRLELGTHCVFPKDQLSAYRSELSRRLFGGADLERHLRLLHIVRSPRVGDKINEDLPRHLTDALPPLSESAIDDAARPLEDLDEHRDSVASLRQTADSLAALGSLYRDYAASEVRAHCDRVLSQFADVRAAERTANQRSAAEASAATAVSDTRDRQAALDTEQKRLNSEIAALKERPAYQTGQDLVHLRAHVTSLRTEVDIAQQRINEFIVRETQKAGHVAVENDRFVQAGGTARRGLDELGALSKPWGLPHVPDIPAVSEIPLVRIDQRLGLVAPNPNIDPSFTATVDAAVQQLRLLNQAAHDRLADVTEVRIELDRVDAADREVRDASAASERTAATFAATTAHHASAHEHRREQEQQWLAQSRNWLISFDDYQQTYDLTSPGATAAHRSAIATALSGPMPEPGWASVRDQLLIAVDTGLQQQRDSLAMLKAELVAADHAVAECQAEVVRLAAIELPVPPTQPWQRTERGTVLAEYLEFRDGVSEADRLGIEAAMEASGLLGAELRPDGAIALSNGELLIAGPTDVLELSDTPTSGHTLGAYLRCVPPQPAVHALLLSISTETSALVNQIALATITTEGEFRIGPLHGRHSKGHVEHIGTAARQALLDRQRTAAASALRSSEELRAQTVDRHNVCQQSVRALSQHRQQLPSLDSFNDAVMRLELASQTMNTAEADMLQAADAHKQCEIDLAEVIGRANRVAATLNLPANRTELAKADRDLQRVAPEVRSCATLLEIHQKSYESWVASVQQWEQAATDEANARQDLAEREQRFLQEGSRLATLEDSMGVEWEEVMGLIETTSGLLKSVDADVVATRQRIEGLIAAHATARTSAQQAQAQRAERQRVCTSSIPVLRDLVAVPGLLRAASGEDVEAILPPVPEDAGGARTLAQAIRALTQDPTRPVTADGVRSSVRQRREQLGKGWDAEDQQPRSDLPISIEINGPSGRMTLPDSYQQVTKQLTQQASLLSQKQDQALRNLLQGVIAKEVAEKLFGAGDLVDKMNERLRSVTTIHGISASLRWKQRDDLSPADSALIGLLAKAPDLRDADEDAALASAMSSRIEAGKQENRNATYRELIAQVLDYKQWFTMSVLVHAPGENPRLLAKHPRLSEGEKKIVSYLPLFAAVAASCDAMGEHAIDSLRFVLLDDAFAKVSADNHASLFGLLVDLDLDFIVTSERLWGTHASVPTLSIVEVVRDAATATIVLETATWDGHTLTIDSTI